MTITLQSIAEDFSDTHVKLREFLSALEPSEDLNPEEIMEAESIANGPFPKGQNAPKFSNLTPRLSVLHQNLPRN